MAVALLLHLFFAVVWVGGMFFAWLCLRPAAGALDAPTRLKLWAETLGRFFPWILAAVVVLLLSGFYMLHAAPSLNASPYAQAMMGLGIVMMLLFLHVYFAPFKRLKRGVAGGDSEAAGRALNQIRVLVGVNLLLGVIVLIAAAGAQIPY